MTDVDTLVKTTLEKLGYPVERLIYTGKAETFITYQIVVGLDTHFSDDESGAEEFTYRADIYSRVDYIALMRSAKRALKEAGFYGITFDPEVFERMTAMMGGRASPEREARRAAAETHPDRLDLARCVEAFRSVFGANF